MDKRLAKQLEQITNTARLLLTEIDSTHTGWYFALMRDVQIARKIIKEYNTGRNIQL